MACSIMVVAIAVERYAFFREADSNGEAICAMLDKDLEKGEWQAAAAICESTSGAVAGVLASGLRYLARGRQGLENSLEGATALVAAKLRRRLDYLDTIVTLAPLLGLLGTVVGMIQSFSIMSIRSGQPQAITGGVGEALVATATGLCVAILAMIIHSYFKHRLDAIITDIEQACSYLLGMVDR